MRAELLALSGLLYIANEMGLPKLKVCGDSKTIIDWINEVAFLRVLELDHWCTRSKLLRDIFATFGCQHIFREHNGTADGLSKETLQLTIGHL